MFSSEITEKEAVLKICAKLKANSLKCIRESKATDCSEMQKKYNIGKLMAYHRVITLMQQDAINFLLTPEDLGLHDIDEEVFFSV